MYRRLAGLILVCAAMAPLAGHAHEPTAHSCRAPTRPVDDQDDVLWYAFLKEIEVFQACVNTASELHLTAAREHQSAARAVVEAWSVFVRDSLNPPADYPGPPKDAP